jgi:hypothetical protein
LWFGLHGKYHADFFGSIVGVAAMTWMLRRGFGHPHGFARFFTVVFLFHTAGYYGGGQLHAAIPGAMGKLLWGAAYGLGFGVGLGYVLFYCQRRPAHPVTAAAPG